MTKAYKNAAKTRTRATDSTVQTKPIPGQEAKMKQNSQGGFSFKVDDFTRLDRFLVLGSEGGSFYASEQKLTKDNAKAVMRAIATDGVRVVNRIVEISEAGRAPKNDPALFCLALVMAHGDENAKIAAYAALPKVARIGTHVLHLASYIHGMRGWGRGIRRAFAAWYNDKTPLKLAEQLVKYANRDKWTHADVLRLAHVTPATSTHDALFTHVVGKAKDVVIDDDVAAYISAVDELKSETDVKKAVKLITDYRLPREVIPTSMMNEKAIWEALVPHMGMTALVRNLATMTRAGYIGSTGAGKTAIIEKMADAEMVKKSRIHPIQVLAALLTYKSGRSMRGSNTWTPVSQIVDALDEMYYLAFQNVIPTGKRIGLFLDVSGSMMSGEIAGVPGLSPRVASAAMAMMTMRTEKDYVVRAFTGGGWHTRTSNPEFLTDPKISARQRLDNVINSISGLPFGGTDCSLPMLWAMKNKAELDAFIVYTDSETAHGSVHPVQALRQYRNATGIDAKLIVVGMVANDFSIADPDDAGMMDVVGFDTSAPSIMSDFIRGDL